MPGTRPELRRRGWGGSRAVSSSGWRGLAFRVFLELGRGCVLVLLAWMKGVLRKGLANGLDVR